jgi:hypothetical protein
MDTLPRFGDTDPHDNTVWYCCHIDSGRLLGPETLRYIY